MVYKKVDSQLGIVNDQLTNQPVNQSANDQLAGNKKEYVRTNTTGYDMD